MARSSLSEIRQFYARQMAAMSGSTDPRLERIFEMVPREAFLPPGPWTVNVNHRNIQTPSADPSYLYQNTLVAIDAQKGINNGEPFLHAAWIGRAAPQPGETITHIGAGTGYYTALLSMLVLPDGHVRAFEIDDDLAERARRNLEPFENVILVAGDAVSLDLPASDVIYVNAGVASPPARWLKALRPNGRMVFPWRPAEDVGLAVLVTRLATGYACRPFMQAWFIPCVGASNADGAPKIPSRAEAQLSRSIWLASDRAPDETATADFGEVWFSSEPAS